MTRNTTTDGNNDPALSLPLSSYDDYHHSINKTTTTKNKTNNRRNTSLSSSSLLQVKIILTLVLIFGVAILSTFIQVLPLIIGNNPRQLSTHTIVKPATTSSTSTTLRTAAAAKTAATATATATSTNSNNIPIIINGEPDGISQYDIVDINGNDSHDSNNNIISSNLIQNKTKKFFDPTQITTIYHLGHKRAYGRSNNQIVTILHAIDIALDNSNGNTDTVVVAVSKWAFDILKGMCYNGWEGKKGKEFALQLEQLPSVVLLVHEDRLEALNLSSATKNKKNNNNNNNNNTIIQHIYLDTKATYFYIEKNMYWNNIISVQNIEQRRKLILGQFFQQIGIADRNLVLYNIVQNYINTNNYRQINNNISSNSSISNSISKSKSDSNSNSNSNVMNTKYVTIHSRWLEGECERRVGDLLPAKDECWMTPSYIKDIIAGINSGGNGNGNDGEDTDLSIGNNNINQPPVAIVFISDGQNKEVLINLKNDPDIGPSIIVPRDIIETLNTNIQKSKSKSKSKPKSYDDIVLWWTQPWNDMMVAIHSDIFIGTRSSTFATIVGMSRIAIGKDPNTNYIYTEQKQKLMDRRPHYSASVQQQQQQQQENKEQSNIIIDVCEECLFLCNKSQSHLCGHDIIFS